MYLWCQRCEHAHPVTRWSPLPHEKYGVCPSCGCSEYRNAVPWEQIQAANDYPPIPDPLQRYPLVMDLF